MNYLIAASTDIGISKSTNQDSLLVKRVHTQKGNLVFALICDGMGGLEKGETASASLIHAFDIWLMNELPSISKGEINEADIQIQWSEIIKQMNDKLQNYGVSLGVVLGTTVTGVLFMNNRYLLLNVGDSRIYELGKESKILTTDHTVIAKEIREGRLTKEQAKTDPRRSVLLQCVGASEILYPEFMAGDITLESSYLICSDGFRHVVSEEEIASQFAYSFLDSEETMQRQIDNFIEEIKRREESDNISAILIKPY